MSTTIERMRLAAIEGAGLDQAARRIAGFSPADLQRHLQTAGRLLSGESARAVFDTQTREWLYAQARATGHDPKMVDRAIEQIASAPDPRTAAARYAAGATNNPEAAAQGLKMAEQYQRHDTASTLDRKLDARVDRFRSSELPSAERFKQQQESSGDMRRTIEATLRAQAGYISEDEAPLEHRRQRAMAFANTVADRMESDDGRDLRATIANSYDAAVALENKADLGISDVRMSDALDQESSRAAQTGLYEQDIAGG